MIKNITLILVAMVVCTSLQAGDSTENDNLVQSKSLSVVSCEGKSSCVSSGCVHDLAAIYQKGVNYRQGLKVERDLKQAFQLISTAAEGGYAPAEFDLAVMHREGTGTEPDKKQFIFWCQKSADHGHADAQNAMGAAYELGIPGIVKVDEEMAISFYEKAVKQDHKLALANLERLLG